MKKLILLALVACAFSSAHAVTEAEQIARDASARTYYQSVKGTDSVAINLHYVGTASEAVVTISQTQILFYAPAGTADTRAPTSGVMDITASTTNLMGSACKVIDQTADYDCSLQGARSSDRTNLLRNQTAATGTNDLKANGGFDVGFDTNPVGGAGSGQAYWQRLGIRPESGRSVRLIQCVSNPVDADYLRVYGQLKKNAGDSSKTDDTIVFKSSLAVAANLNTWNFTVSGIGGIEFADNAHVVVSNSSGTTNTLAEDELACWWDER